MGNDSRVSKFFFFVALFSYILTSSGLPLSFYTDIKTDREQKNSVCKAGPDKPTI